MKGINLIQKMVRRGGLSLNFSSVRCSSSSSLYQTTIASPAINDSSLKPSLSNNLSAYTASKLQFQRTLCSSPDDSNVMLIKSEEQFNSSMKNVQDKCLPAIFYFTAVWCGPCKFIAPILKEESNKYPDVTTYKIDIDQEGLRSVLSRLGISAVPTLHFFENGKKVTEVVGADIQQMKDTMEELYGKD
ncbi:thioredoxin O2, mitochondrial-like isoform X1 [Mercurialis annua]|uniref:thioredoxin O2, mitochondrial-like isoform X1 n=1 Tax=Mercurialis annua TaxID=3986 RepID=UPI0024ADEDA0|nr:thioredoxin O2, mitochondrial-like isoform X1 [Mercurialis annua]